MPRSIRRAGRWLSHRHRTADRATGPALKDWDATYKFLTDHGFSKKAVLKGIGSGAGEAYGWAIQNADKVACLYAENPVIRTLTMSKTPPSLIDGLAPLAKAGVPLLHECGSLDPWLESQTREVEKHYKDLGGQITVIVNEGQGHFRLSPKNPQPVVDFILAHQK